MRTQEKKKRICALAAAFLLLVSLMPLAVFAEGASETLEPPYEKTVFQQGNWYLEYLNVSGSVQTVVGYRGSWVSDPELQLAALGWSNETVGQPNETVGQPNETVGQPNETVGQSVETLLGGTQSQAPSAPIPFTVKSDSFVTAIHVPYSYPPEIPDLEAVNIVVLDTVGNVYGPFPMTPYLVQGEAEQEITVDPDGNEILTEAEPNDIYVNYAVSINEGLLLEEGDYFIHTTDNARIVRNSQTGEDGAVMVVGIDYNAWMAYIEEMETSEVVEVYDFTGRYRIDFDTLKTSTIMGPVEPPSSSMSLKDFELTVLDHGDVIQLIGKYEGLPFSQMCSVTERTENWLSANLEAEMDLTKLPYKAKIGGYGVIVLEKPENGPATFQLLGEGTYERAASSSKGADSNTYDLKAAGSFAGKDLPAYVAAALAARMPNAGGVPGPDNATQGAVGALFPPLAAVVANAIQNALIKQEQAKKAKAKAKKKSGRHDKNWYKEKYPGKTDSELAMIMVADAMGNTDNPDDDPFSVGDNESSGQPQEGNDWEESDESDYEEELPEESEPEEELPEDKLPSEKQSPEEVEQPVETEPPTEPEPPAEPETMTVTVDAQGRTVEYVKDPATGEWVNPETGGAYDPELHKSSQLGWEKDREAIDKNRDSNDNSSSEWDQKLRTDEQERQKALEVANVRDKIMSKYGTKNVEDTMAAADKMQAANQKVAEAYIKAGNTADAFEKGAKVVVNVADATIDGMGNALGPTGRAIRAGYKTVKGVAETTAEHGLSWQNVGSGLAKGGADAASDFTNPKWSKKVQTAVKVGLQVGSEVVAETTSSGGKGFVEGLKKGVVKAVADAIPDAASKGYGGDLVKTQLKNGQVRVAVNNAGKWSGRTVNKAVATVFESQKNNRQLAQTGIKTVVNLGTEFGVKPYM